jgi:carboxymethylenebutenolidase
MNSHRPLALLASLLLAAPRSTLLQDPTPAPKDPARERLDGSPRHHEWLDVKHDERTVRCFVAFPEVKDEVPAVLVIHENKGLSDWVRSLADQLAEAGYVAIAPDLLSGMGPNGGNSDAFERVDEATQAIGKLDPTQVMADLGAVADHVLGLAASNGKLSVAGFCWGGARTFELATARKGLQAAFVFYGSAPADEAALARIECPVYGFYGESDARITASVAATGEAMKRAGKAYEPVIFAGAGHGFMRAGEAADASAANRKAREDGWKRWKELLAKHAAR